MHALISHYLPNAFVAQKLIHHVQTLHANGVANYSRGFEYAFQLFEEVRLNAVLHFFNANL